MVPQHDDGWHAASRRFTPACEGAGAAGVVCGRGEPGVPHLAADGAHHTPVSVRLHHQILHINNRCLPVSRPTPSSAPHARTKCHIDCAPQVFFPLVPGVPTLLEPVEEQVGLQG